MNTYDRNFVDTFVKEFLSKMDVLCQERGYNYLFAIEHSKRPDEGMAHGCNSGDVTERGTLFSLALMILSAPTSDIATERLVDFINNNPVIFGERKVH